MALNLKEASNSICHHLYFSELTDFNFSLMGTAHTIYLPGKSGTKEETLDARTEFGVRRHKAIIFPKKMIMKK